MTAADVPDDEAARLRAAVLERLEERLDDLMLEVARALRSEVSAYDLPDRPPRAGLRWAGRRYARISLAAMGTGGRLHEVARDQLREIGRDRARQGIPLHAVVHACQVAARVLWRRVVDELARTAEDPHLHAELLADLSTASLQLTSEVAAAVTEAYTEASQDRTADLEHARHAVWQELLRPSGAGSGLLRRRAEAVGYRLGDAHVVAVVAPDGVAPPDAPPDGTTQPRARTILVRVTDALRDAGDARTPPIVERDGASVVGVYPVPLGSDEATVRAAVHRALDPIGDDRTTYVAATGRVEADVEGIAASFRQASRTLEFARECGLHGRTLGYERSLPHLILRANPGLAEDLQRSTIAPLAAHDASRGSDLVATCEGLIAAVGNRAEAAKQLHVHRHTLAARLARIEELSGCSLDDDEDVLRLTLGLRAHRLLEARTS